MTERDELLRRIQLKNQYIILLLQKNDRKFNEYFSQLNNAHESAKHSKGDA